MRPNRLTIGPYVALGGIGLVLVNYLIWTVFLVSLFSGVVSLINYIRHPLSLTPLVKYDGQTFWIVAFVALIALYLGAK